ncbi:MAG: helix-turn-helix domain-containing protein [Planctomycetota bacterium]
MTSPAQPNRSVIDGLAVLQAVASTPEPVGVRELARLLELEPTRVQRLLGTLAHLGMTEQDAERKYRPGPGIHVLAAQAMFGSGLLRRAIPLLEDLRPYGFTVALGVLWRDKVAYLYFASPGTPSAEALGNTQLFPADRSAIGQVLQAMTGQKRDAVVRRRGYALTQRGVGDCSVAVPVGDPAIAAVALAGNINDPDLEAVVPALRTAAEGIAADAAGSDVVPPTGSPS